MGKIILKGLATNIAENARHHMEFLYPLASSTQDLQERFKKLENAVESKHIIFQGFYLHDIVDDKLIQFCIAPNSESQGYFIKVGSVYSDEIDAHMNMFDTRNKEFYLELVSMTVEAIQKVLTL